MFKIEDYQPLWKFTGYRGFKISPECEVDCGLWGHKQKWKEMLDCKPFPIDDFIPLKLEDKPEDIFQLFCNWRDVNTEYAKDTTLEKDCGLFRVSGQYNPVSTQLQEEFDKEIYAWQDDDPFVKFGEEMRAKSLINNIKESYDKKVLASDAKIYETYEKEICQLDGSDEHNLKELEKCYG